MGRGSRSWGLQGQQACREPHGLLHAHPGLPHAPDTSQHGAGHGFQHNVPGPSCSVAQPCRLRASSRGRGSAGGAGIGVGIAAVPVPRLNPRSPPCKVVYRKQSSWDIILFGWVNAYKRQLMGLAIYTAR